MERRTTDADLADRIRAVANTLDDNIMALFKVAGFDLSQHLRFSNWAGVSFAGCDLMGCDFTGANLSRCDFSAARIQGARFDQAEVTREQLWAASDWASHVESWTRAMTVPNNDRHLPIGAVFSDAPSAPEMVVIAEGRLMMGSTEEETTRFERLDQFAAWERPRHEVQIGQRFALARYAVTFDEYDGFCAATGRERPDDEDWGRGRRPVINVSWDDATAYCDWLSDRTGAPYRLPSEAEWEYACRAGTDTAFSFGEIISTELANYDGNYIAGGSEKGEFREQTVPVDHGQFQANAFCLWQMHGNVFEWCEDAFVDSYADTPTDGSAHLPKLIPPVAHRVVRGGSWGNVPQYLRSAVRLGAVPDRGSNDIGFRPARTLFTP